MTLFNLGSINIDHVHRVPHFPGPGETLADLSYAAGLGGKGANQSLSAVAAGAQTNHIGAVGADGVWAVERLAAAGIGTGAIAQVHAATGHAVIYVDPAGENQIVIHGGANRAIVLEQVTASLDRAAPGDWFLTQNETNGVADAMAAARARGLQTAHVAAPFVAETAAAVLPLSDLLIVNEGEARALADHLGLAVEQLPVPKLLITLGAEGAVWIASGARLEIPAFPVTPVDTTGAGDTFTGYALAGLDRGEAPERALARACAAAALSVTRSGAADAIPSLADVDAFLKEHGHG
ncbi:MAG: ribokinase [Pseudomonadota bacterium]